LIARLIISLLSPIYHKSMERDRVNLLSVGESQRVPAADLSRLDFLKFTSFRCLLSNVA